MLPEERTENLKLALFSFIETNYTLTSKEFQGEIALDTTAIAEWVWFGMVGETGRRFMRHANGNNLGELVDHVLECIIHVKPTSTITRINTIRDTLVALLRRAAITVTDVAGGTNANIGRFISQGILATQALGIENDVDKFSILFNLRWLEQFSPS